MAVGSGRRGIATGARVVLASVALGLAAHGSGRASTLVAPHALFMRDDSPSAVLYLQNTGDRTQEVAIDLQYGYPVSDSTGNVHVELIETPDVGEPSAAKWVRALPRRTFLYPGERRAVRFLAEPDEDLADGEYWTRVIVASQESRSEDRARVTRGVQTELTLRSRLIIPLSYRKGAVVTGVDLRDFQADVGIGSVTAHVRLERTGNAAYLAKLELQLIDPEGQPTARWERDIAVYRDLYRRIELPAANLPGGEYTLALRLSTERDDVAAQHVLACAPVEVEMPVLLP